MGHRYYYINLHKIVGVNGESSLIASLQSVKAPVYPLSQEEGTFSNYELLCMCIHHNIDVQMEDKTSIKSMQCGVMKKHYTDTMASGHRLSQHTVYSDDVSLSHKLY